MRSARRLRIPFLLLAVLVALPPLGGCHRERSAAPAQAAADRSQLPHPLVWIGVDGLEWRLVLDLLHQDRLPQIAALFHEGRGTRLRTLHPAFSPPIWTSMATGMLPERHGILGFVQPANDGNAPPRLFTSRERRVKAIWDIAGDAGLRSCVVGYWMTSPVEEMHGVMVAQTASPPGAGPRKGSLQAGRAGQVHPVELEERIFGDAEASAEEARARERRIFGDTSSWPPALRRVVEQSRWSLATDAAYERIALDLVREPGRCDLVIVYFGLADVLGHRFWRWSYPGDFASPPAAAEVSRFGQVLARAYEEIDRSIGRLREAAGDEATIVVTSDHGMGAFRPKSTPDLARDEGPLLRSGGHSAARDALFVAAGPGIARLPSPRRLPQLVTELPRSGSVLDVAPTLLALLALPRGRDMDGRVERALVDPSFLAEHPLTEVPTHTPKGWMHQRRFAVTADDGEAERLEQLRGLGYLE